MDSTATSSGTFNISEINFAVAFVSQPSNNINWRVKNISKQYNPLSLHSSNNDDNDNGKLGRRGILKTLLGGALSMAATDTLMNAAIASISNNPLITSSALYRRILSFGSKYSNAGAVASTDLTAFVASQKGHIPEIQAWLAAQQKLQTVFLRTAAASSSTATATTMAAARRMKQTTRGGGIVEEVLTVATAIKAGNVLIEKSNNSTTAEDYTVDSSLDDAGDDDDALDDKERL